VHYALSEVSTDWQRQDDFEDMTELTHEVADWAPEQRVGEPLHAEPLPVRGGAGMQEKSGVVAG